MMTDTIHSVLESDEDINVVGARPGCIGIACVDDADGPAATLMSRGFSRRSAA